MTPARTARLLLLLALPAGAGCGTTPPPTEDAPAAAVAPADAPPPPDPVSKPRSARPDPAQLGYAPARRVLTLYALPHPSARWMVALPGRPRGVPVDGEYEFPPTVAFDLDQVGVFYTVAGASPSPPVTLQEIIDAQGGRAVAQ